MAYKIGAGIDQAGVAQIKRALMETVAGVRPLEAALKDASQQSRAFKDVSAAAVSATAKEYRQLAPQMQGVQWNEFVAEMTIAAKTEQALAGTTAGLANQYRNLSGSVGQAAAAKRAYGQSAGFAANKSQLATQASYALQDALSGGAMGGLKGAALGASNNLGMMAMTLGGPWGLAIAAGAAALPLIITAVQHFTADTKEATEAEESFTDSINKMSDAAKRAKEIESYDSGEANKEISRLKERQALTRRILDDQSMSDEKRKAANEEFHRLQGEIEAVSKRELDSRHAENKAYEKNRTELAKQLGYSREAVKVLNEQEKAERDAANERLRSAKASESVDEVLEVQREVSGELKTQVSRLKSLKDELYRTRDAAKAVRLEQEMEKAARAIKKAQDNLRALDEQLGRAEGAERRAKREKELFDKYLADKKEAQEKELQAQIEFQQKLRDILAGKDPNQQQDIGADLVNQLDPKEIAKQVGRNREAEARANGATDEEAEAARRKGFRDANRGILEQDAFGRRELGIAQQQLAQQQVAALQQGGQVSGQLVQALSDNINEAANVAQELNAQSQIVKQLQEQIRLIGQNGRRRRQNGGNP